MELLKGRMILFLLSYNEFSSKLNAVLSFSWKVPFSNVIWWLGSLPSSLKSFLGVFVLYITWIQIETIVLKGEAFYLNKERCKPQEEGLKKKKNFKKNTNESHKNKVVRKKI